MTCNHMKIYIDNSDESKEAVKLLIEYDAKFTIIPAFDDAPKLIYNEDVFIGIDSIRNFIESHVR